MMRVAGRIAAISLVSLLVAGCSRAPDPAETAFWRARVATLADLDGLARLDAPTGGIVTSCDPSGGNDDYNRPLRIGPDGWWVIADLAGPGCVTRFWNTGPPTNHRFRLYFDNERKPRVDDTILSFFQNNPVFKHPLSNHEQGCKYSYLPIPYAKRLVITAEPAGTKPGNWPRLFHQINYVNVSTGTVQSFRNAWSADDHALAESVRKLWTGEILPAAESGDPTHVMTATVAPGVTQALDRITGPGIIRRLEIEPHLGGIESAVQREQVLREVILRIRWDDCPEPSVEAPLGEFFGSFQRRIRYQSLLLGMKGDCFFTRFPMPFASGATIELVNQGRQVLPVTVRVWAGSHDPSPVWGYLHAVWMRTTPADVGKFHPIVRAQGRGKYVGCLLDTMSQDNSWWLLEGDEMIRTDGAPVPQWLGTGLEDYFNGGWYYFNLMARPLSGLLFKSPFRTLQYRFHLPDPVGFRDSIDMVFERGPGNASKGWMESVAYYYLEKPQAAASRVGPVEARRPEPDPFGEVTLMNSILGSERLGDFEAAEARVREHLELNPESPFAGVWRLRALAYREAAGDSSAREAIRAMARVPESKELHVQQAGQLAWFQEHPANALLGAFCNSRSTVTLDGRAVMQVDHPEQLAVVPVRISPGRHVLGVTAVWSRQDPWVQVCLRTHSGDTVSTIGWKWMRNPPGNWQAPDYDDSGWNTVERLTRDLPSEPYYRVIPNGFVGMQSAAGGMNAPEWNDKRDTVVFRTVFESR